MITSHEYSITNEFSLGFHFVAGKESELCMFCVEVLKENLDAWMDGCMDGCIDGCLDGWMHGWMDGKMDELLDERTSE